MASSSGAGPSRGPTHPPRLIPPAPPSKKVQATHGARLAKNLKAYEDKFQTPAQATDAMQQELQSFAREVEERGSIRTNQYRAVFAKNYELYMDRSSNEPKGINIWTVSMVLKHSVPFFGWLVALTTGRGANGRITAATLMNYKRLWFYLVYRNMVDDEYQEPSTDWRTRNSIFCAVEDAVIDLIERNQLDRHQRYKLYFGRGELEMVIDTLTTASALDPARRLVWLSRYLAFLFAFYLGVRPSTLGPAESRLKILERFPKVKDLQLYYEGPLKYTVWFDALYFKKSLSTAQAIDKRFKIVSVLWAHNVKFDAGLVAFVYCFAMGWLVHEDLDTALKDTTYQVPFRSNVKDQPLFPKANEGGSGFVTPLEAALSVSFTKAMANGCRAAGLAVVGLTAVRRDVANDYCLKAGEGVAQSLLNHDDPARRVLRRYYLTEGSNYDWTSLRHGERDKDGNELDPSQIDYGKNFMISLCLDAKVRQSSTGLSAEEMKKEQDDELKRITKDALQEHDAELQEKWDAFLAFLTITRVGRGKTSDIPRLGKAGANRLFGYATGSLPSAVGYTVELKSPSNEYRLRFEQRYNEFLEAVEARNRASKSFKRTHRAKGSAAITKAAYDRERPGTLEERSAIAASMKTPQAIQELIESMVGSVNSAPGQGNFGNATISFNDIAVDHLGKVSGESATSLAGKFTGEQERGALFDDIDKEVTEATSGLQRLTSMLALSDSARKKRAAVHDNLETLECPETDDNTQPPSEPENLPHEGVQEEKEPNVFADLSVDDVRQAWLTVLWRPFEMRAELKPFEVADQLTGAIWWQCPRCPEEFPNQAPHKDPNPDAFYRHQAQSHSAYKKAINTAARVDSGYLCPSCPFVATSTAVLERHMLGVDPARKSCPNEKEWLRMYEEHKAGTAKWTYKPGHDEGNSDGADNSDAGDEDDNDPPSPGLTIQEANLSPGEVRHALEQLGMQMSSTIQGLPMS